MGAAEEKMFACLRLTTTCTHKSFRLETSLISYEVASTGLKSREQS